MVNSQGNADFLHLVKVGVFTMPMQSFHLCKTFCNSSKFVQWLYQPQFDVEHCLCWYVIFLIWQIHWIAQTLSSSNKGDAKHDEHVIAFCCTQCTCSDEEKANDLQPTLQNLYEDLCKC